LGVLLALSEGRPAHLAAAERTLVALPLADQLRLGIAVSSEDGIHVATYRQVADTFDVLTRPIDPSPVPSFRDVAVARRAEHLAEARRGTDAPAARAALDRVVDALVEASVPDRYKSASSSLAVDWTDHETWARPRPKDDTAPSADPDASWGHAKRNAPGALDHLFFGYYAQVATMVHDDGAARVPELVRRIAVHAPSTDPPAVMAATLVRARRSGLALGDVLCDCGYSNRAPGTFAAPLRRAGARLVMDLHPADRGPRGTFEGAVLANGSLYCPATPPVLLGLGPLRRGASDEERRAHDQRCEEAARYRFGAHGAPGPDGYQRFACPAAAGKLRCALKAESLAADYTRPTVRGAPDEPPRCCQQRTITVTPDVNAKTAQKFDYPSPAHRASYARRVAAERTYASLADPATEGIRRGWSHLFGVAKNTVMYALAVVVRNVRIVEGFERRAAEEQRRAAVGGPMTRRRRRRQQQVGPGPNGPEPEPAPTDSG
jgi:hypothetical protein